MGWGKTQPTLPCQEYAYNLKLLVRGWGKTGPAHSFPTFTRLNINLMQKVIRWGKDVVRMVNGVGKNSANLTLSRICVKPKVAYYRTGKNWAGPFFPQPDKVKHQPCSEGYWVGKTVLHMVNCLRKNTAKLTLS